jgi:hypothetical protein
MGERRDVCEVLVGKWNIEDPGINGIIILKYILKKVWEVWSGLLRLMIWTSGGLF